MFSRQLAGKGTPTPREGVLFFSLLAGVLALGVFLRTWNLDGPSLWEDEFLTLDRATMDVGRMFQVQKFQGPADTIFDLQPPLVYAALHAVLALSETTLAARSLSAAAGILTVAGFFLLGSRTAGRRVGLLAALACAVSLYHVDASRSIKHYALFLCLALYSLYFFLGLLRTGSSRSLAAFAACGAGMLYCGYQGVGLMAAMALGGAWAVQYGAESPGRPGWARLGLAVGMVTVAYLPYAQAPLFLREFLYNPGVEPAKTLTPGFFLGIFNGFISHVYAPSAWQAALVATLCLAGAWGFARDKDKTTAVMLACWAILPSALLVTSRSDIQPILSSRHFVFLFIPGVLCAARGLDACARRIANLALPEGVAGGASLGLALAAILGLAALNLDSYRQQMGRDIGFARKQLLWISREAAEARSLRFLGYKRNTMRFAGRWHLPGQLQPPGDWDTPGYRREFLIDNALDSPDHKMTALPGVHLRRYGTGVVRTNVSQAGFANRAPLVMLPDREGRYAYADDFRGYRFLEDCRSSENFSPDLELGLLRPDRYSRPSNALYVFQVPPGGRATQVLARLAAQAYKRHPSVPMDSSLEVLASPDGQEFTSLARIGQESFAEDQGGTVRQSCGFFEEIDFYGSCLTVEKGWDLSRFVGGDGRLFFKIVYTPGVAEGFLNVAGFGVSARVDGPVSEEAALAEQVSNLVRNVRAVAWRRGEVSAHGVYVFAGPEHPGLGKGVAGMSQSENLGAFLEENPGAVQVYALKDGQGRDAATVYDILLGTPGVRLSGTTPERTLRLPEGEPMAARGMVLVGRLRAPTLEIAGRRIEVPVIAPEGSVLSLNAKGQGRLAFSPDFASGFEARDTYDEENLARASHADYQGGVTCKPGTRCHFTYLFVSAFPIESLRVLTYPRLYGQPGHPGRAEVSFSADGGPFMVLDVQTADRHEDWTPMHAGRALAVRFGKPAREVRLRFSLQANESAEFWSHTRPTEAMRIEADLGRVWLEPVEAAGPEVSVKLLDPGGNDLRLRLSREPLAVRDAPRAGFFGN